MLWLITPLISREQLQEGEDRVMDREKIFILVKKKYGIDPDYPWKDENAVLRHPENKKWFAVILKVGREKLGLSEKGMMDVINVKCEPVLIGSLRTQQGFHPAYHMNKDQWISIRLDGCVPEEQLENLIDLSYQMTMPRKKGKMDKREQR